MAHHQHPYPSAAAPNTSTSSLDLQTNRMHHGLVAANHHTNVPLPQKEFVNSGEATTNRPDESSVALDIGSVQAQAKAKAELLKRYKNDVLRLYDITNFADRMQTLISAWRSVVILLDSTTPDACDNVMHLVLRHTLHTMLMGQWSSATATDRSYIRQQIEACIPLVESCSQNSLHRCRYILTQLDQPWEHPALRSLMGLEEEEEEEEPDVTKGYAQSQEILKMNPTEFVKLPQQSQSWRLVEPGQNDPQHPLAIRIARDIEYLTGERGCMIALRLQKLCESRLYEMACMLAGRTLRALRSCPARHPLRRTTSPSQIGYIHDLYLVLLYRLGKYINFLEELRAMDLASAVGFCARNPPQPEQAVARLMPLYDPVLDMALQVFLTRFLSQKLLGNHDVLLRGLCILWVRRNSNKDHYWKHWRHLVTLCGGYQHFYVLLDALVESFPKHEHLKEDKLEMLCRGMTHELNELEQMKTDHSIDAHRILAAERQIAPRFLALADMFEDFQELARELTLTSFSLHPTEVAFMRIQQIAEKTPQSCDHQKANESKVEMALLLECPFHDLLSTGDKTTPSAICKSCELRVQIPVECGDQNRLEFMQRVGALHSVTGNRFIDITAYNALAAPNLILDAIESLSEENRHDLLTLISAPRIKNLSWLMSWPELQRNCAELLRTPAKINRIEHTVATANDHLEFLHPDFERYRHLDPHQYPGIETGYEIFYRDADDADEDALDYLNKVSNRDDDEDTSSASETERSLAELSAREKKAAQLAARKRQWYLAKAKRDPQPTMVRTQPGDRKVFKGINTRPTANHQSVYNRPRPTVLVGNADASKAREWAMRRRRYHMAKSRAANKDQGADNQLRSTDELVGIVDPLMPKGLQVKQQTTNPTINHIAVENIVTPKKVHKPKPKVKPQTEFHVSDVISVDQTTSIDGSAGVVDVGRESVNITDSAANKSVQTTAELVSTAVPLLSTDVIAKPKRVYKPKPKSKPNHLVADQPIPIDLSCIGPETLIENNKLRDLLTFKPDALDIPPQPTDAKPKRIAKTKPNSIVDPNNPSDGLADTVVDPSKLPLVAVKPKRIYKPRPKKSKITSNNPGADQQISSTEALSGNVGPKKQPVRRESTLDPKPKRSHKKKLVIPPTVEPIVDAQQLADDSDLLLATSQLVQSTDELLFKSNQMVNVLAPELRIPLVAPAEPAMSLSNSRKRSISPTQFVDLTEDGSPNKQRNVSPLKSPSNERCQATNMGLPNPSTLDAYSPPPTVPIPWSDSPEHWSRLQQLQDRLRAQALNPNSDLARKHFEDALDYIRRLNDPVEFPIHSSSPAPHIGLATQGAIPESVISLDSILIRRHIGACLANCTRELQSLCIPWDLVGVHEGVIAENPNSSINIAPPAIVPIHYANTETLPNPSCGITMPVESVKCSIKLESVSIVPNVVDNIPKEIMTIPDTVHNESEDELEMPKLSNEEPNSIRTRLLDEVTKTKTEVNVNFMSLSNGVAEKYPGAPDVHKLDENVGSVHSPMEKRVPKNEEPVLDESEQDLEQMIPSYIMQKEFVETHPSKIENAVPDMDQDQKRGSTVLVEEKGKSNPKEEQPSCVKIEVQKDDQIRIEMPHENNGAPAVNPSEVYEISDTDEFNSDDYVDSLIRTTARMVDPDVIETDDKINNLNAKESVRNVALMETTQIIKVDTLDDLASSSSVIKITNDDPSDLAPSGDISTSKSNSGKSRRSTSQPAKPFRSTKKLPTLRSSSVRLIRLSDELIGYHLQDKHFCNNNRLLQNPVVLLNRLDDLSQPPPAVDDDDLQPAADLIQTTEIFEEADEDDIALRFFQPSLFANAHPEVDPLYLDDINVANTAKPIPPSYRFNASVVHGMATKHLDQMVDQMASPSTSFSTEIEDEDDDNNDELDDESSSVMEAKAAIDESFESAGGTDASLDDKLARMRFTSSSQSSASSRSPEEINSDDDTGGSKTPVNGDRSEDDRSLQRRRQHDDEDDASGEGTGGPSTGGHANDAQSGGQMGNDSSGGGHSRPHRDSSDSSQNSDGAAGSSGPVSQLKSRLPSGTTTSSHVSKRPGKVDKPKMQKLTFWVKVNSKAGGRTVRHATSPASPEPGTIDEPDAATPSTTNTPSPSPPPPTTLSRRAIRKPRYLYDYCPERETEADGQEEKEEEQPSKGDITIQQLREAINLALQSTTDSSTKNQDEKAEAHSGDILTNLTDTDNFSPSDNDRSQIVNIVQLAKSTSTIKATTTSVNSADALGSGNIVTRQLMVNPSTAGVAALQNKTTTRAPTQAHQLATTASALPPPTVSKNPPQHLLQILNAPPSRNISKTHFTATATNGNILAASSSFSSLANDGASGSITIANPATSLNSNSLFICKSDGKTIHLTPIQATHGRPIRGTATANTSRNGLIARTLSFNGGQQQPGTSNVLLVTSSANHPQQTTNSTSFVRTSNGNLLPKFTQAFAGKHVVLASSSSMPPSHHDPSSDSGECLVTAAASQPVIILDSASSNCDLSDATSIVLREPPADASTSHVYYARKPIVALEAPPPLHHQQQHTTILQNHLTPLTIVRPSNEQMVGIRTGPGISRVIVNHNRGSNPTMTRCVKVVSSTTTNNVASLIDTKITTSLAVPRTTIRPTINHHQLANGTQMIRPVYQQQKPILRHLLVTTAAPSQQPHQPRFSNGVVIRHPMRNDLIVTTNPTNRVIGAPRTNLSATSTGTVTVDTSTLEQLREFDAVLEQVKERSHTAPTTPTSVATTLTSTEAVMSVIRTASVSKPTTIVKHPAQQTLPNIVYKTANGQMVNLSFLPQTQTISTEQPPSLVVVHSKQNPGSQVPNVTLVKPQQAPFPSPSKSLPSPTVKKKSYDPIMLASPTDNTSSPSSSKSNQSSSASSSSSLSMASPASAQPTAAQKPQEDEQTVQRIYDILAEYAEQLRNSPDLNNKPAPRRRSNLPANPGGNTSTSSNPSTHSTNASSVTSSISSGTKKRKYAAVPMKTSFCQTNRATTTNTSTTVGPTTTATTADSDDSQCPTTWTTSVCGGDLSPSRSPPSQFTQSAPSNIVATRPIVAARRQIIFTDSPASSSDNNQPQSAVVLAEPTSNFVFTDSSSTPIGTVLMPTGSYVLPTQQQIAIHSSSGNNTTHSADTQQGRQPNRIVLKGYINHQQSVSSNAEFMDDSQTGNTLYIRSAPRANESNLQISSSAFARVPQQQQQQHSVYAMSQVVNHETPGDEQEHTFLTDDKTEPDPNHQYINEPMTTPNHLDSEDNHKTDHSSSPSLLGLVNDEPKSTLLRFGTPTSPSLDPDLSHRNSKFCMMSSPAGHSLSTQFLLDEHLSVVHHPHHSSSSANSAGGDSGCPSADGGRVLMLHQPPAGRPHPQSGAGLLAIQERRRVALEREISLQKSLSEECEDLGVDEPSTSDLFPEAELPFDSGSPPFDLDLGVGSRSVDAGTPNEILLKPRVFFGVSKRKIGGSAGGGASAQRIKGLPH